MRHERFEPIHCASCPLKSGPCLAGLEFLETLSVPLGLARQMTGEMPDLEGRVQLNACPARAECALHWRAVDGQVELHSGEQRLWQGQVTAQLAQ
ncbi:hypothetical protein [Natronohydrobacter thiooxidans]|uniref:hypothetical protein n=1 Tax=Natronohydrobacter thiooxidans TaxID=87172 RepID=UPI000B2D2559|nr:hypothetical protein [Natronohydrobacter thiooxidans]